ncbi:MAG TPA: phospholipase A [Nevskia sp.]|nr:phospholipase A [Nevskia sp.]
MRSLHLVCAGTLLLSAGCATAPERAPPAQACPAPAVDAGASPTAAAPWGFAANTGGAVPASPPVADVPLTGASGGGAVKPGPSVTLVQDRDNDPYQIVSAGRGLSLHKPMYILPATWTEDYHGRKTEMLFQISLKQRLFGVPLYFGYTQKSFFDIYDSSESKPFRESDYNPELFYRYIPSDRVRWHHLGADFGIEHESNGKGLPDSRSWNRLYIAPFQAEGEHLFYWKWWWRLPEDKSLPRTDPNRDDNPDIGSYYGYSELHYEQQLFGSQQMAHAMLRWNPVTGRAAASLLYTIPNNPHSPDFFWTFYFFQGYGESLIDYNRSITRVGVGVSLTR